MVVVLADSWDVVAFVSVELLDDENLLERAVPNDT